MTNRWGCTLIGIAFHEQVDLAGAYFAAQGDRASWTTGVRVHGYREGAEIATTDWFTDIGSTPEWFTMNLAAVDRVVVESVPVYYGGGWYGMDDLTYTPVVPEPSVLVPLGVSVFGLSAYAWRRRRE